jgi:nitrite reductase/ring-hydroxylating ferredoxin subunit
MPAAGLEHVATYRRRIAASTERVWENVRDWEHLPYLHASSFRSIALAAESESGWRARIGLYLADEIELELAIEPRAPRYVSRTLAGPGAGSEIWTSVAGVDADATDIEVEFWIPGVAPASTAAVGAGYTRLYERLWDEDESMMVQRARELARSARATPSERASLGRADDLRAKATHCFAWAGRPWRLVALDGAFHVHATTCPHWLGPLDAAPVQDGAVTCPWHGWRFDVRTGAALDGRRARLPAPP